LHHFFILFGGTGVVIFLIPGIFLEELALAAWVLA